MGRGNEFLRVYSGCVRVCRNLCVKLDVYGCVCNRPQVLMITPHACPPGDNLGRQMKGKMEETTTSAQVFTTTVTTSLATIQVRLAAAAPSHHRDTWFFNSSLSV